MSNFDKDTNVPSKDIVYRQDVEDMLRNALPSRGMWEIDGDVVKNTICETVVDLMMDLKKVPSVQPDLQPTCNQLATDCISRQAAIDAIHCDITITGRQNAELVSATIGAFADRIKALPSAQQWIPCSERLPEDVEIGEEYPTVIFCTDKATYAGFYEHYLDGKWWTEGDYTVDGVIAWMPLPEPYKGEK